MPLPTDMPIAAPPQTSSPQVAPPPQGAAMGIQAPAPPQMDPQQDMSLEQPQQAKPSSLDIGDPKMVEEQTEQLVTRGMEMIHSPQTRDQIANNLKNSTSHVQSIADTARHIVTKVSNAAANEGIDINVQAKMQGGVNIVSEIAEIAEAVGAPPMDEDDLTLAYSLSVQDYLKEEIATGRINPDELKKWAQDGLKALDPEQTKEANDQMLKIDQAAMKATGKIKQPSSPTEEV